MFTQGTLSHSVWRGVVAAVSFGLPLVTLALPGWENITIGAVVFAILHYAEGKLV